ncbi:hypothetical protein EDC96DRAFT_523721 [Choanephora cucurbitarum]|nr:hypothetical protein EDC96DRAFT_523721 [Choanephora cucurbitarum]
MNCKSSASWEITYLLLNGKAFNMKLRPINLLTGEHTSEAYHQVNPTGKVPAFITKMARFYLKVKLSLNTLKETYPAEVREIVRSLLVIFIPFKTWVSLNALKKSVPCQRKNGPKSSITLGFQGLEKRLEHVSGTYSVGDAITMADFYLCSIVGNAHRWGVDMSLFPIITRINNTLMDSA